ncbi:hypothetical protein ACHAWF_011792 [Thalassiosira exigua]
MVKFKGLKGKKKSSRDKKAAKKSPLMADSSDDEPVSSSSSRAGKDERRAAQKKEREERRKKRDQQLEELEESRASGKSKSKSKKSKPKLSQEERDAKDSKLGCCHHFAEILVKIVHVLDGLIGFTFVVYGSLIMTQFKTPAMEAVITTLTFGCTMLASSIMGVIGFYTNKCDRVGLSISAYMGPLIAFFYIFAIIALLSSPDTYFDYLTEHKDVLYLNDAEILTLKQILPFFYIVLASLSAIEIFRFFMLRKVRINLVKADGAKGRIAASQRSQSSKSSKASTRSKGSKTSSRSSGSGSKRSGKTKMTEPLIRDEEMGSSSEDSDW